MNRHILISFYFFVYILTSWSFWLLYTITFNLDPNGNFLTEWSNNIIFNLKLLGALCLLYGQIRRSSRILKDFNVFGMGMLVYSSITLGWYEGIQLGRDFMLWTMIVALIFTIYVTKAYLKQLQKDPDYASMGKSYHQILFFIGMLFNTLLSSGNAGFKTEIHSHSFISFFMVGVVVTFTIRFIRLGPSPNIEA